MKISFNWRSKNKSWIHGIEVEDCLSKEEAGKLRSLDPVQIMDMESGDRIELFISMFGEEKATFVNSRLEKDFILPKQKEGLLNWINGQPDVEDKWRKEIVREIALLDRVLSDKELDIFLDKLASLKLGVGVTREEAQKITLLCEKANKALAVGDTTAYDKFRKELQDYTTSLTK